MDKLSFRWTVEDWANKLPLTEQEVVEYVEQTKQIQDELAAHDKEFAAAWSLQREANVRMHEMRMRLIDLARTKLEMEPHRKPPAPVAK